MNRQQFWVGLRSISLERTLTPIEGNGIETTDRLRRTTTKRIVTPRLEIGSESFTGNQIRSAQIHTHEDGHSEFRSASVTLKTPFEGRWDYDAAVRIYVN